MKSVKCEICSEYKESKDIDSKLIGIFGTRDGWICKQCVKRTRDADDEKVQYTPFNLEQEYKNE